MHRRSARYRDSPSVYLQFYGRKWKRSTILTKEDTVKRHLITDSGSARWAVPAGYSKIFWTQRQRACRSALWHALDSTLGNFLA